MKGGFICKKAFEGLAFLKQAADIFTFPMEDVYGILRGPVSDQVCRSGEDNGFL